MSHSALIQGLQVSCTNNTFSVSADIWVNNVHPTSVKEEEITLRTGSHETGLLRAISINRNQAMQ